MNTRMEVVTHESTAREISHPTLKFAIGFFAGLCAVFSPKILTVLAVPTDKITLFSSGYVALGLAFATMIGVGILIIEWKLPKKPVDTFTKALGLPALLAGALNTASDTNNINTYVKHTEQITSGAPGTAGIPILPFSPISPIEDEGAQPVGDSSSLNIPGISAAHAGTGIPNNPAMAFNPGIQIQEQHYLIVLARTANRDEAIKKAQGLRSKFPNARVVRSGNDFLIIHDSEARIKSEVLPDAIRIRDGGDLQPSLMEAR